VKKRQLYVGARRFGLELRRLLEEPEDRLLLRRALDEALPGGATYRLSDGAVAGQAAALLESGRMRLWEGARVPEGVPELGPEAEAAPEKEAESKKAVELTWIEIRLIGEDDKPIPGERYRLELPDGSVREGTLDDRGLARVDGIDAGECEVTFPRLDEEAWARV
jgi:hypothetical protein